LLVRVGHCLPRALFVSDQAHWISGRGGQRSLHGRQTLICSPVSSHRSSKLVSRSKRGGLCIAEQTPRRYDGIRATVRLATDLCPKSYDDDSQSPSWECRETFTLHSCGDSRLTMYSAENPTMNIEVSVVLPRRPWLRRSRMQCRTTVRRNSES
jgi:hypothetical protein